MIKRLSVFASLLAWSLTVTCQTAGTPSGMPSRTPGVMGEQVIVKFAPNTPARGIAASALAGGPESQARLAGLAASLSAELNIPLRIERLTSGQEFVISINADDLASRLVTHLSARTDVKRARLLDAGDRARHRYWNPTVAVEFRAGSTLGQALAGVSEGHASRLTGFATEVGDHIGFPVRARAPQTVELVIDMSSVATDLVERLKRRTDVEYAQRDLLMRPFSDNGQKPNQ